MGDLAPHLHRRPSQLAIMVRWDLMAGNFEAVGDWRLDHGSRRNAEAAAVTLSLS